MHTIINLKYDTVVIVLVSVVIQRAVVITF